MGKIKQLTTILAVFGALLLLIEIADAVQGRPDKTKPIKCYQCNSFYDKGCSDFFDNRTYPLIPCKGNTSMCRKVIQETYYDGHWDVRYIRQCAQYGEVGPAEGRWCKERSGNFRVKVKVCHCDNKDGCNAAPRLGAGDVMGAVLAAMFLWTCLHWKQR